MINSIELVNWKTHGSTKISFAKGTNILIGQMGAGKSSIMDAISFGLFGTFPALKNRRVGVGEIIRNRPDQKRRAKVKINFTVGQDTYVVEREISLDEVTKATLEKNGAYVQTQSQRVTEEIDKALRMDYDLFSRAIYSEQNRLDYFLELRAGDRKKQMDNLLGLDKFANAQENTTSLINRIKDMIEESRKTAEGFDIEGQKKQLAKLEEDKGRLSKERDGISTDLEKFKESSKNAELELKELRDKYNKKILTTKEVAEFRSRLEVIEKEIGKIDAQKLGGLEELRDSLKALGSEMDGLRDKLKEDNASLQGLKTKFGKAQNELSSVSKDIAERDRLGESVKGKKKSEVVERLEKHRKEMEKFEAELAHANAEREQTEKWIKELERHISRCPVCEREMDSEMKETLLKMKKALVRELAEKARTAQELKTKNRKEVEELNALINKLTVVEDRLKSYLNLEEKREKAERELEKTDEEIKRYGKGIERLGKEIEELNKESSRLSTARDALERRSSYLTEKKREEEALEKKRRELEKIDVDEKQLEKAQKEFTSISSEISRREAMLGASKKELSEKLIQIEERRREVEKIEKLYGDMKGKKVVIDNLARFNNSLQETQAQLRNRLVGSINKVMQQIWPELYPYGDYPNLELIATESDYLLRICTYRGDEEVWENVDTIASGGERYVACLALRVAFALVLVPNLKWIILDEPTHNIDQLGINRFVRVFNETLPGIVEQIFIITHDEQLKQVSSGKVYLLSRNKEESGETVAEEL